MTMAQEIPASLGMIPIGELPGNADQERPNRVVKPIGQLSALVGQIREEHRLREDYRRTAAAINLRMCAIIRRLTGCEKSAAPKILKQVFSPQKRCVPQACSEGEEQGSTPGMQTGEGLSPEKIFPLLAPMKECQQPLLACQKSYEKTLIKMAKQLPVWLWVEGVRGFGPLSLAQIIGETGDLSGYANPAKVWKRMGLAVIGAERQRRHSDVEKALANGYSPKRRAVMWNVGCCLIKQNDGEYRAFYDAEKARQMVKLGLPDDKPGHAHNRAQRHMEKLLLKDLWARWNQVPRDNLGSYAPLSPEPLEAA